MRRTTPLTLLVAAWLALPARADFVTVNSFGNLLFWSGSGANQAALVAYFDAPVYGDGAAPAAVAWGYRWDGAKTQADMLFALAGSINVIAGSPPSPPAPQVGSDPRLAIDVEYSSYTFEDETFSAWLLTAIRYDQIGLPAPWPQTLREMTSQSPPDIAPYSFVPASGTAWPTGGVLDLIADTGISDTLLQDRGWYGFVAAEYLIIPTDPPDFVGFPATFAFALPTAAVPEPCSAALLACGGVAGALVAVRRRRGRLHSSRSSESRTPTAS